MYMSQHRFTPVPEKLEQWIPYNRNYMALTSRAPGAVLSRILRLEEDPRSYFAVGIWSDKDRAVQWTDSPESRQGAQPSQDLGLYDGYPMAWSRWTLIDFSWGPEGRGASPQGGGHIRHVVQETPPLEMPAVLQTGRAILSLLSYSPGFVSGETYVSPHNDRLLTVLTFKDRSANPFEAGLPGGLKALWDAIPATVMMEINNCTSFECVWGPEAARLETLSGAAA